MFLIQGVSNRRTKNLENLAHFLDAATAELVWLSDREEVEISRDWSAKGLNPAELEQYFEVS